MNLKQRLKAIAGSSYLNTLGRIRLSQCGVVLMLHRVVEHEHSAALPHRRPLCVGRESFEKLLRWLPQYFDCVPLQALLEHSPSHRPRVALTFDDGWRDNAEHAFPLLERYQMPASIFLSTDFIGSQRAFWWEAIGETLWQQPQSSAGLALEQQLKTLGITLAQTLKVYDQSTQRSQALAELLQQLKVHAPHKLQALADSCPKDCGPHSLDWHQVKHMERSGLVRFGPHGASHSILTQLDETQLRADLVRSHHTLSAHCESPLGIYCYPNGDHNSEVRKAVAALGYRYALSTAAGLIEPGKNQPLALPRIDVSHSSARHPSLLAWRILKGARA